MANKSLTDLTARTATADSDLIHVNSGGTDYKETKSDFLQGTLRMSFSNTSLFTTQADALPAGSWFGSCNANGHQTETGCPVNSGVHIWVWKYSSSFIVIEVSTIGQADSVFRIAKNNGTWQTSWTRMPTRNEAEKVSEPLSMQGPGSKTFSISNSTRALVVLGGSASARWGMWYVYCGSSGTMYIVPVGTPGGNVTLTSSANNRFTASTTASNAIAIDIVRFTSGTIEEV